MAFIVAVILLLCSSPVLHADGGFTVEHLTIEQGLSQSIVYGAFQDRAGFLWFSTRDGINRYDGYRFMVFRHDPFNPSSLPWTAMESIAEDANGNIWLGCALGVAVLDRRTFCATVHVHDAADPRTLGSNVVTCMTSDRNGEIWIGTEHGLNHFDPRTGSFVRFFADSADPASLGNDRIVSLYRDRFGDLWIGTWMGYLHRLNPDRRSFTRFATGVKFTDQVVCFGDDRDGRIYIGNQTTVMHSTVNVIDRKSGAIVRSIPRPLGFGYPALSSIRPVGIDSLGGLLMAVSVFGESVDQRDGSVLHRMQRDGNTVDADVVQRVAGEIRSVVCDRSGTVWVGSDNGVVKLTPRAHRFITYRSDTTDRWSLSNSRIRSVLQDRSGTLWVGTDIGLNRLDGRTGRWKRYLHNPADPRSICGNAINTIFEESDGTLIFGTNNGASVLDPVTDLFSQPFQVPGPRGKHDFAFIWSFCRDSQGRLWVGTRQQGIFLFDRDGRYLEQLRFGDNGAPDDDRRVVWDIHRDRQGDIWAATSMGLYRWSPGSTRLRRYPLLSSAPHGVSEQNVCAIMEDPAGILWFTTYGGGINRYNRVTDDFTSITTRDGLPSNTLYGTLMDNAGRLWISSNNGLVQYDPATGRSRLYNAGDGLQGNEFSFKAWCRLSSGELLFGGIHGLSRFHPDSLRPSARSVPVVITEFRVFDAIVRQEIVDRDTVTLSYDQSFISFEFAALDDANPAGIRYAYRMVGFDDSWIHCGQRRYASFTNLDPGSYVFMVQATNSDGVWSSLPLHVVLRVVPPYWMTWWFRGLAVIGLLAAGGTATWLRVRSAREGEQLRRRSVESQLHALRLQVNPHFIFNALSSVQHLILVREHDLAVSYLSRFSRLVRAVLENSERMSISIAEEIDTLRHYLQLESLRFEQSFVYSIEIDPLLDIHRLAIPTMLIQPCVENAIRHGLLHKTGEGHLAIAVMGSGERIRCVIEDDGIGRKRAGEIARSRPGHRRSMGMRVTEERLAILNAALRHREPISMNVTDLIDGDGVARGTRVEIFIPQVYL